MERVTGIEPVTTAWEAVVLPLNYTRILGPNVRRRCTQSLRFVLATFIRRSPTSRLRLTQARNKTVETQINYFLYYIMSFRPSRKASARRNPAQRNRFLCYFRFLSFSGTASISSTSKSTLSTKSLGLKRVLLNITKWLKLT